MKNKSTGSGERKKGFYTALAAGAGAVLVLALVISFTDLTINPAQELSYQTDAYEEEALHVGFDYTRPYLAQADMDQALFRPRATASPNPSLVPSPTLSPSPGASPGAMPVPGPSLSPSPSPTPPDRPASTVPQEAPSQPESQPQSQPEAEATSPADEPAASPPPANESAASQAQPNAQVTTFHPFAEGDELLWPVYGDIAMIFSQDRLIYNATLDQWRTNDDLRISAQEGTPVRASAAGKVVEVGVDREYGNFVRLDNGNGWETIFGQLMDNILVAEGDIVQAGQVIGGVGRPSVFSVLDGHHVSLRVFHEEALMDPQLLLADNDQ